MSGEHGLSAGQLSKVLGCPDPAQLEQHGHENQHAGGAGSMPAQPAHVSCTRFRFQVLIALKLEYSMCAMVK
jgi:hypothetical protein